MAIKKIQIIPPDGGYVDKLYPETSAEQVIASNGKTVEVILDELFQSANNGKTAIRTALSNKGVTVSLEDTFTLLASKITAQMCKFTGSAVASDVLSGKTFINSTGNLVTGSMTNRGAVVGAIARQSGTYTIPTGYHNGSGKVTANISNLSAGNIKKGVNVGGVVGNFSGVKPILYEKVLYNTTTMSALDTFVNLVGDISNGVTFNWDYCNVVPISARNRYSNQYFYSCEVVCNGTQAKIVTYKGYAPDYVQVAIHQYNPKLFKKIVQITTSTTGPWDISSYGFTDAKKLIVFNKGMYYVSEADSMETSLQPLFYVEPTAFKVYSRRGYRETANKLMIGELY